MTPEDLWKRYATIWSAEANRRALDLAACVTADVTYCDPNGLIEGQEALSGYMGAFQSSVPGGWFLIRSVQHHHERSLAHWSLCGANGGEIQTGISFATVDGGRLRSISGFFHTADPATR